MRNILKKHYLQVASTNLNSCLLLNDFEIGDHTSASSIFKNITIQSCRYHLYQIN